MLELLEGVEMAFCDYLKEITAACASCYENGINACHIKLGEQEYYKGFAIYDTIVILRQNHQLAVETDIEVVYKTEYPYGMYAGKGPQFAAEYAKKEKAMRDYLAPKLPSGAKLLSSHQHYSPDRHDPERVAIHIHAHKIVQDLDEAKLVAGSFVQAIKPPELNKIIETE